MHELLNPTTQSAFRAAERIAPADELVRHIVRNLPCPAFWKTADHRFAGCNQAFADLLGLAHPDELIGQSESDVALLSDALKAQAADESILRGAAPEAVEIEEAVRGKGGQQMRIRTRRSPLFDTYGRVFGILGTIVARDPAESLRARAALQQQQLADRVQELEEDLENARQLQRYLMEQPVRDCPFLTIAYQYRFADKVGGDFIGLRAVDADNHCFLLADLTGHGVSAALFTALLKYIAKEATDPVVRHPEIFLSYLDQRFFEQIPNGFFTALAGTISRDPFTGSVTLSYANAAHPAAIVVTANGAIQHLRSGSGAVGLIDDCGRAAFAATLAPGDRLYVFTDGFEETADPRGAEFGRERIAQCLAAARRCSLDDSINRLYLHCETFRGPGRANDDMTIVAFEAK